jgi:hypothetical protein
VYGDPRKVIEHCQQKGLLCRIAFADETSEGAYHFMLSFLQMKQVRLYQLNGSMLHECSGQLHKNGHGLDELLPGVQK